MEDLVEKLKQGLHEKMERARQRYAAIEACLPKLKEMFAEVQTLGCEPHTDGDWIFVPLSGDKHKFLAFVRIIRKHGFEKPNVEKNATGFSNLSMLGEVPIYFQFSSTACRRVKIGTKTVEQDVFETVCDEMMPYGDSSPAPVSAESTCANDIPF